MGVLSFPTRNMVGVLTMHSKGDHVTWEYGTGIIGKGVASGTIIETGMNKFGHDDVIKAETDDGEIVFIQPETII